MEKYDFPIYFPAASAAAAAEPAAAAAFDACLGSFAGVVCFFAKISTQCLFHPPQRLGGFVAYANMLMTFGVLEISRRGIFGVGATGSATLLSLSGLPYAVLAFYGLIRAAAVTEKCGSFHLLGGFALEVTNSPCNDGRRGCIECGWMSEIAKCRLGHVV